LEFDLFQKRDFCFELLKIPAALYEAEKPFYGFPGQLIDSMSSEIVLSSAWPQVNCRLSVREALASVNTRIDLPTLTALATFSVLSIAATWRISSATQ